MRRQTKLLLSSCLIILSLFVGSVAAASPFNTDKKTDQAVKAQKTTDQTAVTQERTFRVEGAIMGQVPITARYAFEGFELPDAPAREFGHVPIY